MHHPDLIPANSPIPAADQASHETGSQPLPSPKSWWGRWIQRVHEWDARVVRRYNAKMTDETFRKRVYWFSKLVSPWLIAVMGTLLYIFAEIYDDYFALASYYGSLMQVFIVFMVIKLFIRRYRPYLQDASIQRYDRQTTKYGFPSGHTLFMTTLGSFFLMHYGAPWLIAILVS